MLNGLGIYPAPPEADWLEVLITNILNYTLVIIYVILAFEIFLLLYSKKTS